MVLQLVTLRRLFRLLLLRNSFYIYNIDRRWETAVGLNRKKQVKQFIIDNAELDAVEDILMTSIIPENNQEENDHLTEQELQCFNELREYVNNMQVNKHVYPSAKNAYTSIVNRIQSLLDNPAEIRLPTNSAFQIRENISNSKSRNDKDRANHHFTNMLKHFKENRVTANGDVRVTEDGSPRVTEDFAYNIN